MRNTKDDTKKKWDLKKKVTVGLTVFGTIAVGIYVCKNFVEFMEQFIEPLLNHGMKSDMNRALNTVSDLDVSESVDNELLTEEEKWITVREHVRNLRPNWHPSPEKLDYAERCGIILEKNQTIVNEHIRVA